MITVVCHCWPRRALTLRADDETFEGVFTQDAIELRILPCVAVDAGGTGDQQGQVQGLVCSQVTLK